MRWTPRKKVATGSWGRKEEEYRVQDLLLAYTYPSHLHTHARHPLRPFSVQLPPPPSFSLPPSNSSFCVLIGAARSLSLPCLSPSLTLSVSLPPATRSSQSLTPSESHKTQRKTVAGRLKFSNSPPSVSLSALHSLTCVVVVVVM